MAKIYMAESLTDGRTAFPTKAALDAHIRQLPVHERALTERVVITTPDVPLRELLCRMFNHQQYAETQESI